MAMDGAKVGKDKAFDAETLRVVGHAFLRDVGFGGPVDLIAAKFERNLDLRGSSIGRFDLSGAFIGDDLVLGGLVGDGILWEAKWTGCGQARVCLNLRNARIGNLQDTKQSWPARINLEGFTYTHLGGSGGDGDQDMRNRDLAWWREWLGRDPVYSPQPYAQLAGVQAAAGNRDAAAFVRFTGRDRERLEAGSGCGWLQWLGLVDAPSRERPCHGDVWLGLSLLQSGIGYGIGAYSFRVVGTALAMTVTGTIILWFAPGVRGAVLTKFPARRGPRRKSAVWCVGASLNRLLPLVTISQEFNDFFNDPNRERLRAWQQIAFAILAFFGWALGLFVVAAFSGLTQS